MSNGDNPKTEWKVVAAAVLGGVVAALHVGKVPAALPEIRADLGLGLVSAGFVISVFNLLGMCLGALIGTFAESLGRRRMVKWGCICLITGGLTGTLSGGLAILLFSRALEGMGFIAIAVAMPSIVASAASDRDRALALSIWSVFTPTGFAIALLTTSIALEFVGWRGYWLAIAALTLAISVFVVRGIDVITPPQKGTVPPMQRLRQVAVRPRLLLLALAFGSFALQWVTLMAWLPTFLIGDLSYSLFQAAAATAVIVAANVPGNLLGGALMRHGVSPGTLILLGSAVMAISVFGIFLPGLGDGIRLACCLIFSCIGGLVPACLFALVPAASPSAVHLGPANGILMQGSTTGQFAGPPIVGAAITAAGGGWEGAIPPLIAAAVVTAAAGYLGARLVRASPD